MPENAFITFIPFTLPEGTCFSNEQERYNKFVELLSGYLPGNFSPWNTGSSEPTVENRGLPWHKTFADGSPDGDYDYFNGAWVRLHPVSASSKKLLMWTGTPTELETEDGGSAGAVSDTTGPFWEIVATFVDKIPVGAGVVAVNTNASELTSGASATDQVRGTHFIQRTQRKYITA